MFINLSNHQSSNWDVAQYRAAEEYGNVIDMPFPNIEPEWDEEINDVLEEYKAKILKFENPVVMIQGEFTFTYRLINWCKEQGIKAVCSCTKRVSEEEKCPDGQIKKISFFKFVRFREY